MSWNIQDPGKFINGPLTVAGSATISGNLTVDTNTLFVDSANNRVGIRTVTPVVPFDIRSNGDSAALFLRTTDPAAAVASAYIQAPVSTGFSSTVPVYGFWYQNSGMGNPATDTLNWIIASSEAMRLNSTGLGVGVVPTIAKVQTNGAFATTGAVGSISTTPLANALIGDFNTTCRLLATGPNTTTAGVHKFIVTSSDASVFFETMTLDALGNVIIRSPATPATLTINGQLTVNATSNTNLRFSYRGSDGTTRVANLALA